MCKCTPEIRTPWCGKPGCEWPEAEKTELKASLFKLIEHNSEAQMNFSSHDDTRKHLTVGKIYAGIKEVHSFHTEIWIGDNEFNSVCFEEIESTKSETNENYPLKRCSHGNALADNSGDSLYPSCGCGDPSDGKYIWCYVAGNQISPEGNGKSLGYAMTIPGKDSPKWKLYKLVPADQNCDCIDFKK